jgi:uncharacterized protein (DUF362 family)
VIRVGLGRTAKSYSGLAPPYGPGKAYPELASLLADSASADAPNPVYAGVRAALHGLGLDASHFGTPDWNPLGDCVGRGKRVVLKPNFIRHWNPSADASTDCLITHGAVLRAVADYAYLAVGTEGSVVVAEAPQHDCDFDRIREIAGLDELVRFYETSFGGELGVIDLRREAVVYRDGIIVERRELPGDPSGYRVVDLGDRSCFHGSGLDPDRMRGADYDPSPTAEHHRDGRNAYLLSETVLGADLVVNLPKLKTHKKTGVTLALKNLVGINGDKNWLPHHCAGPASRGGDEFPEGSWLDHTRSRATDFARRLLARGIGTHFFRAARRAESALRGDDFIRSGNWHGNRTTWRMCLDLNRCLYYSRPDGAALDAESPVRSVLTVLDGVVAGEGDGPLAPTERPLGVVLASLDPVALDLVAVALMGFDPNAIPKIHEAIFATAMRITEVRSADDVEVVEVDAASFESTPLRIEDLRSDSCFVAHPGWRGHVEHAACTI